LFAIFFLKEIRTIRALPLAGALLVIFLCTPTSWAMRTENPGSLGCAGYIQMYLEQAVRRIVNVGDLSTFDRVPRRCAGRKGQILTMPETVRDAGVSVPSIKKRVGILQARYQIHLLPPHSANLGKHIVESPKLDFLTR
jgi:predicted AAA+ superfamily ATPase